MRLPQIKLKLIILSPLKISERNRLCLLKDSLYHDLRPFKARRFFMGKILARIGWVGSFLLILVFTACQPTRSPYHQAAAQFIQTYYLNIDPKGALEITEGPARQKMLREVELLKGVEKAQTGERPEMEYQIKECVIREGERAQCHYELYIDAGRKILRKGRLTLRPMAGTWKTTQFIEELGE